MKLQVNHAAACSLAMLVVAATTASCCHMQDAGSPTNSAPTSRYSPSARVEWASDNKKVEQVGYPVDFYLVDEDHKELIWPCCIPHPFHTAEKSVLDARMTRLHGLAVVIVHEYYGER